MPLLSHVAAALLAAASAVTQVRAYDEEVCGKDGFHSKGNTYAFYPNAWDPEDGGFTCMAVNQDPPSFDVTWRWTETPDSVNSYPHIKFQNTQIPSSIGNITSLQLKTKWGVGNGDSSLPVDGFNGADLDGLELRCNVGWDMFAAPDVEDSQVEVNASTEIMIWLGLFGKPWPLGYSDEPKYPSQTLNGVDFNLYDGMNERGQKVLTWVATENVTDFDADVVPLITYLLDEGFVDGEEIMGLIEFGSEAFFSNDNVTFSAFNMDVQVETLDPEGKYPFISPPSGDGNGDDGGSSGDNGNGNGSDPDGDDDEGAAVSSARLSIGLAFGAFVSAVMFLL